MAIETTYRRKKLRTEVKRRPMHTTGRLVSPTYALKYSTSTLMSPLAYRFRYRDMVEDQEWHRDPKLAEPGDRVGRTGYPRVRLCVVGWHVYSFERWSALTNSLAYKRRFFLVEVKGNYQIDQNKAAFEHLRFVDEITLDYRLLLDVFDVGRGGKTKEDKIAMWADWLELPSGSNLFFNSVYIPGQSRNWDVPSLYRIDRGKVK